MKLFFLKKTIFLLIVFAILQSCKKNNNAPNIGDVIDDTSNVDTIKDIEGNEYETVVIGNQTWMKQNLKTKFYNDSTPIITGISGIEYIEPQEGIYSVYDDGPNNEYIYGLLYNWYVVADPRKVCPQGWHVPTDEEWTKLTDYLSDSSGNAGGKMKSLSFWEAPNTNATNSSGFSALPAGLRTEGYMQLNKQGNFWSSTHNVSVSAWFRFLRHDSDGVVRAPTSKHYGASVRCIKD